MESTICTLHWTAFPHFDFRWSRNESVKYLTIADGLSETRRRLAEFMPHYLHAALDFGMNPTQFFDRVYNVIVHRQYTINLFDPSSHRPRRYIRRVP